MPAMKGSSTSARIQSSAMNTISAPVQKMSWRFRLMGLGARSAPPGAVPEEPRFTFAMCASPPPPSMGGAVRTHMADPFRDIEGDREQGQDGHQGDGGRQQPAGIETESQGRQHQAGKEYLG